MHRRFAAGGGEGAPVDEMVVDRERHCVDLAPERTLRALEGQARDEANVRRERARVRPEWARGGQEPRPDERQAAVDSHRVGGIGINGVEDAAQQNPDIGRVIAISHRILQKLARNRGRVAVANLFHKSFDLLAAVDHLRLPRAKHPRAIGENRKIEHRQRSNHHKRFMLILWPP
jgi:hypothetical protein